MLQTLKITNVALIDSALLNFDKGFNVISGETGAGKSIMLDALSFVFGGRADRTLIREKENYMQVEAIFTCVLPKVKQFVKEDIGIDPEEELFISRRLDVAGKNVCKINGELVPVASVKKLCQMLVDLHGQSEHLSILDNDYQLNIIDLFSKTANEKLTTLAGLIDQVKLIEQQIKQLGGSNTEKQNLIDLYTYQINEINNAHIAEGELEQLQEVKQTMQQFEKINNALSLTQQLISKNSFIAPVVEQLAEAKKQLQGIANINTKFNELLNRVSSSLIELEDVSDALTNELNSNVFDEERFNYVDGRIDFLKQLFRKYGGSESAVLEYKNQTEAKLDNLINGEAKRKELLQNKDELVKNILLEQEQLTIIRKQSAKELAGKLQEELKTLGMPNAKIEVEFSKTEEEYTYTGADRVEFLFSSNLGFELKPLNKVVSGGEMSRVMLAYKIVVSGVDEISTILFDEIDSGLSGNIALVVAKYMARLSANKQIIAVSHLPQICAMADGNLKVEKFSDKTSTHTKIEPIIEVEQLNEIARLMGVSLNENGLKVAKELKQDCNIYKQTLKGSK